MAATVQRGEERVARGEAGDAETVRVNRVEMSESLCQGPLKSNTCMMLQSVHGDMHACVQKRWLSACRKFVFKCAKIGKINGNLDFSVKKGRWRQLKTEIKVQNVCECNF